MKPVKVCALALTAFAALACSTANKETFVSDFSQYPLCIDTDSPSVVFVDIKNGKEVSKRYYEAFPFYNGLAVVKTANGWTYVDKNFAEPISGYYLGATHFSEGVAFTVKSGEKICAINEKGEALYTLSNIESVYSISEKRAVFRDENNKYGLLDSNGEIVCTPKFDDCEKFLKDGTLLVMQKGSDKKSKGKWGIIDCNGEILIPIKYPKIVRSEKGFTIFDNSRKAAWYDLESNTVSGFDFYDIIRDGNQLCYKNKKGKYGWMTLKGVGVIEPVFDEVTLFGKGDAAFAKQKRKAREWGVINKKGEWIITPRYVNVTTTEKYPIIENAHEEYGVADFEGNVLIKTNKSSIKHIVDEYYLVTDYKGETGIMKADGKESWVSKTSYKPSSEVKYKASIMVNNNYLDIDGICNTIQEETDKLIKTTVTELLEAYNLKKENLPKKNTNITLAEHTNKNYTIEVETDKVSAWSVKRDFWDGNVVSYNGKGAVKKYLVNVTLKQRYAQNKDEIIKRVQQQLGMDESGVATKDSKTYKLTENNNKQQTGFKISISIE